MHLSLLGNAFHAGTVAFVLGQLLFAHGFLARQVSANLFKVRTLASRSPTPNANQDRAATRVASSSTEEPASGSKDGRPKRWKPPKPEEQIVLELLRRQTHRGGDVRSVSTFGVPLRWPRQEIDPRWWNWTVVSSYAWTDGGQHINQYEMRSDLSAARWRLRVAANVGTRGLHLMDSQVCLSAIAHGRSASGALAPILERRQALSLAASFVQLSGYCSTGRNPADAPSRL